MLHTPEEEEHYWSLLESSQRGQYPDFISNLSTQTGSFREEGRAAVVEFSDGAKPKVYRVQTSRVLRRYFDEPSGSNPIMRRLFILEGLPRNFIQVLGARLRVPPVFFSAHWAEPGGFLGYLVNRTPRHCDHRNQFSLSFIKMHWVGIRSFPEDSPHPSYEMESSTRRRLNLSTIFGDLSELPTSWEQVSFWCVSNGDSWDAIILVDPPLGTHVKWGDSPIPREVDRSPNLRSFGLPWNSRQRGSWYPSLQFQSMLSEDSNEWAGHPPEPAMVSLFDDMVLLYPLRLRCSTADVGCCTDVCRVLVLSAWTARLRVIESQIAQERTKMSMENPFTAKSTDELFRRSWTRAWQPKDFGRLVRAATALESIGVELQRNLDALGVNSSDSDLSTWEVDAWQNLLRATHLYKSRVDGILQTYMQAISVRQSITTGQLTSMAALFIPVSLVAAIFSMGGKFAAGESLFWVFWVIAIPVASIGCILLFSKIGWRPFWRSKPQSSLF